MTTATRGCLLWLLVLQRQGGWIDALGNTHEVLVAPDFRPSCKVSLSLLFCSGAFSLLVGFDGRLHRAFALLGVAQVEIDQVMLLLDRQLDKGRIARVPSRVLRQRIPFRLFLGSFLLLSSCIVVLIIR